MVLSQENIIFTLTSLRVHSQDRSAAELAGRKGILSGGICPLAPGQEGASLEPVSSCLGDRMGPQNYLLFWAATGVEAGDPPPACPDLSKEKAQ